MQWRPLCSCVQATLRITQLFIEPVISSDYLFNRLSSRTYVAEEYSHKLSLSFNNKAAARAINRRATPALR
jgi:hypothetical protein